MSSEPVISVRHVSKIYRAYDHPLHALLARASGGRWGRYREFQALDDVSFEVNRGESVGIVGRNGSGKSTLLQLICGIRQPTSGTIEVRGRISALLELGSGFHPEFTGRENVFMQGAILGIDREEMESRFDSIASFADIGDHLDQPVKTYSSGMFVRLAFATAINVDPDILIVDEALAVGDALFQKRCHQHLRSLRDSGLTLLLVSHDHELIRNFTGRALLLNYGHTLDWGATRDVSRSYRKLIFETEARQLTQTAEGKLPSIAKESATKETERSFGVGGAHILGVSVLDAARQAREDFEAGEPIVLELLVQILAPLDRLNFGVVIRTLEGIKIYSWGTLNQDIAIRAGLRSGPVTWEQQFDAGDEVTITLELEGNLGTGHYEVQAMASRELQPHYGSQQVLHWRDEACFFRVQANPMTYFYGGHCDLRGKAFLTRTA